jgi:hypothetical protein
MKRLLTSFAFTGLALLVHAQQTGHPGYIVRSAGDTLHGFLQEQLIGGLIGHVGFKARAADGDFTSYTPAQVSAYQYDDGNAYRAVTFTDPRQENALPQTSFVRLLVNGECELYSLYDNSVLYFLIRKDTTTHLLYDDDLHTIPYLKGNFRNELNFFAVGCETARRRIENINFSEQDLQRYVETLDACLAPDKNTVSYYHRAKAHFGFFAYGGGFVFSDSRSQLTGEARLRLTYPQLKANVSFNLGIRYANVVKQLVDQEYVVATIHHKATYHLVSIPFTVQYNLTRGVIQPFLFSGVSMLRTKVSSPDGYLPPHSDFYDKWGAVWLGGAGVEAIITENIQARIEWRYEELVQYPTLGLAIRF